MAWCLKSGLGTGPNYSHLATILATMKASHLPVQCCKSKCCCVCSMESKFWYIIMPLLASHIEQGEMTWLGGKVFNIDGETFW